MHLAHLAKQPDSSSDRAQGAAGNASPSGEQTFMIQARPNNLNIDAFPPEIKNMIYSYVFEGVPDQISFSTDINGEPRVMLKMGFTTAKTSSILRVNKSLSKEARSWLYGSKQLTFSLQGLCEDFLERIGSENLAFVRRIKLTASYASRQNLEAILKLLMNAKNFEQLVLSNSTTHSLHKAILGTWKPKTQCYDSRIPEQLATFLCHHGARFGRIDREMLQIQATDEQAFVRKFGGRRLEIEVSYEALHKLRMQILESAEAKMAAKTVLKSLPCNQFF